MKIFLSIALFISLLFRPAEAAEALKTTPPDARLIEKLRSLDANVLMADQPQRAAQMMRDDTRARIRATNQRDREAWAKIQTRQDWEKWTVPRVEALRKSLGVFPPVPENLHAQVTRTLEGNGFQIENVIYQ